MARGCVAGYRDPLLPLTSIGGGLGFLKPDGHEGSEQAESLARIEAGGIPLRAAQRKRSLATESSLFTSGLSVNEFALLDRMGPQPPAQVMGASVVQTGYQYLPALEPGVMVNTGSTYSSTTMNGPWQSRYTEPSFGQLRSYRWRATVVCELDVLTDAWNMARRRALDRLREEALQVGADAVVGVELHRGVQDFGKGTLEFAVRGTAIRLPGAPENAWPLLTDLSVQDYFKLHKAGYEPAGLLATTAVVFASAPRVVRLQRVRTKPRNQELDELSQAFRLARETRAGQAARPGF